MLRSISKLRKAISDDIARSTPGNGGEIMNLWRRPEIEPLGQLGVLG